MPTFTIDESEDEETGVVSAKSGRRLVRSFEVYTDDPANTRAFQVVEALGTQLGIYIGVPHPDWTPATVDDIDPGRRDRDDPRLWRARVVYTEPVALPGTITGTSPPPPPGPPPPAPPPPPPGSAPAPTDRPAFLSISYRKLEYFDVEDLDGKRLVTTAGDPLEDTPPRLRGIGCIHYTRWVDAWNYAVGLQLIGKVNLFAWEGQNPDTVLIDGIEAAPKTERGWVFWEVKYTLLHDPLGWIPTQLVNAGRRAYVRGQPRTKENLLPVLGTTGVVLLNAAGEQWREDTDPAPVPLDFRFYSRIDFAGL